MGKFRKSSKSGIERTTVFFDWEWQALGKENEYFGQYWHSSRFALPEGFDVTNLTYSDLREMEKTNKWMEQTFEDHSTDIDLDDFGRGIVTDERKWSDRRD